MFTSMQNKWPFVGIGKVNWTARRIQNVINQNHKDYKFINIKVTKFMIGFKILISIEYSLFTELLKINVNMCLS